MIKISELEGLDAAIVSKLQANKVKTLTDLGKYYYSTSYAKLTDVPLTQLEQPMLVTALRDISLKTLRAQSKGEMAKLQLLVTENLKHPRPSILVQAIFGPLKIRIKDICEQFKITHLGELVDLINEGRLVPRRNVGKSSVEKVIERLTTLGLLKGKAGEMPITPDSHVTLLHMDVELCKILFREEIALVDALIQHDYQSCRGMGLSDSMIYSLKTQLEAYGIIWAKVN